MLILFFLYCSKLIQLGFLLFLLIIAADGYQLILLRKHHNVTYLRWPYFKDSFKQLYTSSICTSRQIVRINKTHTPTHTVYVYLCILLYIQQTNDIQVHFGTNLFSLFSFSITKATNINCETWMEKQFVMLNHKYTNTPCIYLH